MDKKIIGLLFLLGIIIMLMLIVVYESYRTDKNNVSNDEMDIMSDDTMEEENIASSNTIKDEYYDDEDEEEIKIDDVLDKNGRIKEDTIYWRRVEFTKLILDEQKYNEWYERVTDFWKENCHFVAEEISQLDLPPWINMVNVMLFDLKIGTEDYFNITELEYSNFKCAIAIIIHAKVKEHPEEKENYISEILEDPLIKYLDAKYDAIKTHGVGAYNFYAFPLFSIDTIYNILYEQGFNKL